MGDSGRRRPGWASIGGRWAWIVLASVVVAAGAGVAVAASGTLDLVGDQTVSARLDAVPFHTCPGTGETGRVHRGDRVLLTGRDESGHWYEVRSPHDLGGRVWVEAPYVSPDADTSDLPVVECPSSDVTVGAAAGTTTTTITASTTTTTVRDGRGTTTTEGRSSGTGATTTTARSGTTTTTTEPDDTDGPSIGAIGADPDSITERWDGAPNTCVEAKTSQVSVSVTDPSGVDSVTLLWEVGGAQGSKAMTLSAGSYRATVGPFNEHTVGDDTPVRLTVEAVDSEGNAADPRTSSSALTLQDCPFG